jgi:hypothetical protein
MALMVLANRGSSASISWSRGPLTDHHQFDILQFALARVRHSKANRRNQ